MIGSLFNGVSGINTYEKAIAIQSNDITNVNTVGHKKSDVRFEDALYTNSVGKGVNIQTVNKVFSQGDIKLTNVNYDVAIEGDGFFISLDTVDNQNYYTRAGNFRMSAEGYLITADNNQVQGASVAPFTVQGSAGSTFFDDSFTEFLGSKAIITNTASLSINAKASNFYDTATDTGLSGNAFITKSALIVDIEELRTDYSTKLDLYHSLPNAASTPSASQVTKIDFDTLKSNLQNQGDSVSIFIDGDEVKQSFDSDASTTLNLFADKISATKGLSASVDPSGIMNITVIVPGKEVIFTSPRINELAPEIENTTEAATGTGLGMITSSRAQLQKYIELAGGKLLEMTNSVPKSNEESLTMSSIQLKLDTLGISTTQFGTFEVEDGNLYMKDGDNKFLIGKLSTVRFADNRGLKAVGDNNFMATTESGNPRYSADTSEIVSSSLELSTANTGDNLVQLLVLQKAFEANSKVISTSDEFLKTAINLKK